MTDHRKTRIASQEEIDQILLHGIEGKQGRLSSEITSEKPSLLGRYQITRSLGRGGMGEVFLGYDPELDRQVAIKVLRKDRNQNPLYIERLGREAKLAAGIHHPNIVRVYDWGEHPDWGNFIVYEFVSGVNLFEKIRQEVPMAAREAGDIILNLADSLIELQKRNTVHRDIKPGNILLSEEGHIKLTDLGIAKKLNEEADQKLTKHSSPRTPDYSAPEQKRSQPVDIRADIYSLGKTFTFLLTGESEYEFLVGKLQNPKKGFTHSSQVDSPQDSELLKAFLPIIRKMTEEIRENRYQSPQELMKDLDEVLTSPSQKKVKNMGKIILSCSILLLLGGAFFIGNRGDTATPLKAKHALIAPSPTKKDISLSEMQTVVNTIRASMKERSPQDSWTSPPSIIMVLPLDIDPGISIIDQKKLNQFPLGSAIKKFTDLPVVERESLKFLLQEYNLEVTDLVNPEARLRLGKLLPASILLEGVVAPIHSNLVLSVKIVNIESSEILEFVETEAAISDSDSSQKLYKTAASKLADSIHSNLNLQGKITSVAGGLAEINLGQYHGIQNGMKFQVRNPIETTRGTLKAGKEVVSQGIVEGINKFSATLRIEESPEWAKPGMLIIEIDILNH